MSEVFYKNGIPAIVLAKGELGKDVQRYLLQTYMLPLNLETRPVVYTQKIDFVDFSSSKSEDVPGNIGGMYDDNGNPIEPDEDYGITGWDFTFQYGLKFPQRLKVLRHLGFGKGDIVLIRKRDVHDIKNDTDPPLVAVEHRYKDLLELGDANTYLRDTFGEYRILGVGGSVERYVARGTAPLGFDFSTHLRRSPEEADKSTIAVNGLKILYHVMPSEAVLISRDHTDYTFEDFDRILTGVKELEQKRLDERNKPVRLPTKKQLARAVSVNVPPVRRVVERMPR